MRKLIHYMTLAVLLMVLPINLLAQGFTANGVVKDVAGEALIGVSITVKGTTTGTVTDLDGNFSIQVANGETLVFDYLGMETMERQAAIGMDIIMQESSRYLDEVVVIGYGVQKRADITTAVSTVTADAIAERPVIATAQALQGKAAGVQVIQTSGKPGGDITVRIRGNTSLNASNEPLYVVDGVPMENTSSVSPNDIESMQILKDASSAAIYGSRAANGVVLITTKRGLKGDSKVGFSTYVGFSKLGKKIKALNTEDYYAYMQELDPGSVKDLDPTNLHYTDWYKEAFRSGVQQNYQLSARGGNEKTTYYVSGNYQSEIGIVRPADFKRFSFHANVDSEVKKWLKLSTNVNFSKTDRNDTPDNAGVKRGGVILSVINTPPFYPVWDPENPGQYQANTLVPSENPVGAASVENLNTDYWFTGNVGLEFFITKGLTFKTNFSYNLQMHKWDYFLDPNKTAYGRTNNGIGRVDRTTNESWLSENILTYNVDIADKHSLTVMGGFTAQENTWDNTYISKFDYIRGLVTPTPSMIYFANQINTGVNDTNAKKAENAMLSGLGRVHYSYDSKYLFTANFRADGSSKFAPGHRWGYFPSFSAGWRMSSESFFEPLRDIINDLKIRGGWGQTGNQWGVGDYDYYARYGIGINNEIASKPGVAISGKPTMSNVDLTWETTTQTNVGLDVNFLNSRIQLTVDAYYKKTSDLLYVIQLPEYVTKQSPLRNAAEMINKGIEFEVKSRNLTGELGWDTEFNMSFNKNELTEIYNNVVSYHGGNETISDQYIILKKGLPLGSFYGYVAEGVDPETGDMIYADLNQNGIVSSPAGMDTGDRAVIGCAQPDFVYGMTNTFSYKDLSFSFFLQGSQGNDIYNASRIETEGMLDPNNQSEAVLDRWRRPGMETTIPRAVLNSNYNVRGSSRFIEDGSYLRLKTVTLSYTLPKKIVQKAGMDQVNIYVTGNNLLTLTKYTGFDPEVNAYGSNGLVMGIDYGTYPQSRSCIFGLNVTF